MFHGQHLLTSGLRNVNKAMTLDIRSQLFLPKFDLGQKIGRWTGGQV
jgi:hypothetical protein